MSLHYRGSLEIERYEHQETAFLYALQEILIPICVNVWLTYYMGYQRHFVARRVAWSGGISFLCFFLAAPAYSSGDDPGAAKQAIEIPPDKPVVVELLRSEDSKTQISSLEWGKGASAKPRTTAEGEVLAEFEIRKNKDQSKTVILSGRYDRKLWTLLQGTQIVKGSSDSGKSFTYEVPLTSERQDIDFTAIGPDGSVENEVFVLMVPKTAFGGAPEIPKWIFWSVGLGVSSISYTESQIGASRTYSSFALTGKLAANCPIKAPFWDVGISSYYTLLPIQKKYSSNIEEENDPSVVSRFLGINLRAGYSYPRAYSGWKFALHGGAYYTTMLISYSGKLKKAPLGFNDLSGVQLFPTIRRSFTGNRSLLFYAKYSPISNDFGLLSLSSRELAIGGAFAFPLKNQHPLSVTLDVANLRFNLPANDNFTANSTSITVGAGYAL